MKKIAVVLIFTALFCLLISCGERESPPAYLPSVRYENVPLPDCTVLIEYGAGPADGAGPAFGKSPEELIVSSDISIPYTRIKDGDVALQNGSDKNASFSISFIGVYTPDGKKTEYGEADLSSLPNGKYVVAARFSKSAGSGKDIRDEIYYLLAGIDKTSLEK